MSHPKQNVMVRLSSYLVLTLIFVLACFGYKPILLLCAVALYAGFKFFIWLWWPGKLLPTRCLHCFIRLMFSLAAVALLAFDLPFQFYAAALLFLWTDYFMRFGHALIHEEGFSSGKLGQR